MMSFQQIMASLFFFQFLATSEQLIDNSEDLGNVNV